MLLLALFGVAYTSIAQRPMTTYWMVLAPFIGMICVIAGGMRSLAAICTCGCSRPSRCTGWT